MGLRPGKQVPGSECSHIRGTSISPDDWPAPYRPIAESIMIAGIDDAAPELLGAGEHAIGRIPFLIEDYQATQLLRPWQGCVRCPQQCFQLLFDFVPRSCVGPLRERQQAEGL